jgi:pterin-4a-carbinolamine dehydratase
MGVSLAARRQSLSMLDHAVAVTEAERALIAEKQGHHPNILLSWGNVEVALYTHKIEGLTENDFIVATRINKLW